MKTCLLATLAGCALFSASSHADTIAGVYAGAQVWQTDTSGGFADNSSTADFNFDDETNTALYVAFEHPLPFVPNIKLGRTTFDNSGTTTLDSNFTFDGNLYTSNSQVDTVVELDATDIILYYELFDNDLISFDVGLNAKYIDGTFSVNDTDSNTQGSGDFSGVVPW